MIIVTADSIPGKNIITTIGHVKGSSARARHAVADVFASLKNIVGGEVSEYSRLLQQTRDQAIERMVKDAESKEQTPLLHLEYKAALSPKVRQKSLPMELVYL